MSTAVMASSSLYDFSELIKMKIDQQPLMNQHLILQLRKAISEQQQPTTESKLSCWETVESSEQRPIPLSLMTSFLLENVSSTPHRKLERTQSETVTVKPSPQIPVNTSRYKTELCRPYEESGSCKYGEKCQFAHGGHELRCLVRHPKYKTELCRTFHSVGFCPYGPRCHFIHNEEEARRGAAAAAAAAAAATGGPPAAPGGGLSPRPARSVSSPTSSLDSSPSYFSPPHSPPPSPLRLPVFNSLIPLRFGSELIA